MFRKVIRITAEDSPNVKLGLLQEANGKVPTNEVLIPGILTYEEYKERMATWDERAKCIGLHADFWEGKESWLFPVAWLNLAEKAARALVGKVRRAEAIGIDPAEGGDKTSMVAVDWLGVIEQVSKQTPDTSVITGEAVYFMKKHNVPPYKVLFDRGGGGKEHADRLRQQGYAVRSIGFGETVNLEPKRGIVHFKERVEVRDERLAYVNRRAQMYGECSELFDPALHPLGFALPSEYHELRRQLGLMPKLFDNEGRLRMLPKNRPGKGMPDPNSQDQDTLVGLLGCSPDEVDALVLAVHGMLHEVTKAKAGAL